MKDFVYLAGPIAGTLKGAAFDWREEAANGLAHYGIVTRSPLRAKYELRHNHIGYDFRTYKDNGIFYTPQGILTRDHSDVITSAAVLMYLRDAPSMSFGTGMELAWCYDRHIPVIAVMEAQGNVHSGHPMFDAAVKFRVETLEEGVESVAIVLGLNL